MAEENIAGPTVLWAEIKDKKVKSKDDKTLGRIKSISPNHFKIEKGGITKKKRFDWPFLRTAHAMVRLCAAHSPPMTHNPMLHHIIQFCTKTVKEKIGRCFRR